MRRAGLSPVPAVPAPHESRIRLAAALPNVISGPLYTSPPLPQEPGSENVATVLCFPIKPPQSGNDERMLPLTCCDRLAAECPLDLTEDDCRTLIRLLRHLITLTGSHCRPGSNR